MPPVLTSYDVFQNTMHIHGIYETEQAYFLFKPWIMNFDNIVNNSNRKNQTNNNNSEASSFERFSESFAFAMMTQSNNNKNKKVQNIFEFGTVFFAARTLSVEKSIACVIKQKNF